MKKAKSKRQRAKGKSNLVTLRALLRGACGAIRIAEPRAKRTESLLPFDFLAFDSPGGPMPLRTLILLTVSLAASHAQPNPTLVNELVLANHILANEGVLDAYGHVSV